MSRIENAHYRLDVDDATGAVVSVIDKTSGIDLIAEPRLAESWRLLLPIPRPGMNDEVNYIESRAQRPPKIERTERGLALRWDAPLVSERGSWDVAVAVRIDFAGDAVEFRIEVDNRSPLVLAEVWHAGLGGLLGLGPRGETETLLPENSRARLESLFRTFPESMGPGGGGGFRHTEFRLSYPNNLSMPWVSMWNPRLGRAMYYACHDTVARQKVLRFEMHPTLARNRVGMNWPTDDEIAPTRDEFPAGVVAHWVHLPFLAPGKRFESAPAVLRCHAGDWHDAARFYREWFVATFPIQPPTWLRREQAVLDIMCMLPEGNVICPFRELPHLARESAEFGVRALMISGWNVGGHDNQYPNYSPDPKLGTWDDLRAAIRECHDAGLRVLFFANIQAVDVTTERYRRELHRYRFQKGGGVTNAGGWGMGTLSARMSINEPPIGACDPGFPEFRRIIVEQMARLAEIGADGVHFDKACMFGVDLNPDLPVGADEGMFGGVLLCLDETLDACRRVNPEFALGVETSVDRSLSTASSWWNWMDGLDRTEATKYTFREFLPVFAVVQAHDYNSVNEALRFGCQLLVGPARWSGSLDDPAYRAIAEYIRETMRIRETLGATIFDGEFLDMLEATVEPREHLRWNTHRDPRTGKRAVVLVNQGRARVETTVSFAGNSAGRVAIHRPFESVVRVTLPASVSVAPERFAVVVEE